MLGISFDTFFLTFLISDTGALGKVCRDHESDMHWSVVMGYASCAPKIMRADLNSKI